MLIGVGAGQAAKHLVAFGKAGESAQVVHVVGAGVARMLFEKAIGRGRRSFALKVAILRVDAFKLSLGRVFGVRVFDQQLVVAAERADEIGRVQALACKFVQFARLQPQLSLAFSGSKRVAAVGNVVRGAGREQQSKQ